MSLQTLKAKDSLQKRQIAEMKEKQQILQRKMKALRWGKFEGSEHRLKWCITFDTVQDLPDVMVMLVPPPTYHAQSWRCWCKFWCFLTVIKLQGTGANWGTNICDFESCAKWTGFPPLGRKNSIQFFAPLYDEHLKSQLIPLFPQLGHFLGKHFISLTAPTGSVLWVIHIIYVMM